MPFLGEADLPAHARPQNFEEQPPTPTPAGGGAGADAAPAAAGGNVAKIAKLMELGFPKEQCEQALSAAGGNEEHAVGHLVRRVTVDDDFDDAVSAMRKQSVYLLIKVRQHHSQCRWFLRLEHLMMNA